MSAKITREELKNSIQETENFISMITKNKYTQGDEKDLKDVINRICDVIHAYCTTEVKDSTVIKDFPERGENFKDCVYDKFTYNLTEQETMINLLKEGKFIPAGSVLAGMNFNKTRRKSLSNCYIIPIEEDSIEGIFNCMRNAARTYSYRGGVGIDLTILRPEDAPVNNAADTSSGAVSFMPLISSVNATIGVNGRRSAMMCSLDCHHPDLMKFIWSKVDPEAVFVKDYMTMDNTAKKFFDYLKDNRENIPDELFGELQQFTVAGALPTVSTANISVKFNDKFMNRVANNDTHPWTFIFPDIEADKDFYNANWKGDYEEWKAKGGKIKEYKTYQLTITNSNYKRFIGKKLEDGTVLTEEILLDKLNQFGGNYKAILMNPTPREIFIELAQAAWTRGDPGVMFWDNHLNWSTFPYIHPTLKPFTTNPCFSLDTYVAVADGRGAVTFRILIEEGKDVPVYTRNLETGKFEIQMGRNPRITRHKAKMVRVHFDNGSYQDVTWDHTFPLQDGRDVTAKNFESGDTLFSVLQLSKPINGIVIKEDTPRVVTKIETIPNMDVANITVDNTHVVYVMTNFGEGNPENYILARNCSEISGYNWAACNLGAHVLPKVIFDDKGDYNPFTWAQNCIIATTLMNFVNDFNETMHPLKQQIDAEQFAKRIGIEFTGLADALSMMNIEYGSQEAIDFVRQLMGIKACAEIYQSTALAKSYGPAPACDPVKNMEGINRLLESPYMKNILDIWNKNTWRVKDLVLSYYKKYKLPDWNNDLEKRIREYGLRNVALNTVGPTGSLSILADNCSSGIEPVFALFQKRTTRVGGTKTYTLCHTPVARRLLAEGVNEITLDEIKEKYKIKEAHELDYHARIAMQAVVQEFTDSSISSTVNLPNSSTPEDIVDVYLSAWKKGLKGITVFRDGCMNSVIEIADKKEKKVSKEKTPDKEKSRLDLNKIEKLIKPVVKRQSDKFFTAIAEDKNLPWGHVKEIKSDNNAVRHEVSWNGYKFYIIVTVDEVTGKPMEVFTSNLPYECAIDKEDQFNSTDYSEKISTWMGLTRIISIALRAGVDVKIIIKQLKKSSVYVGSMVAILARVLSKYTMENQIFTLMKKQVTLPNKNGIAIEPEAFDKAVEKYLQEDRESPSFDICPKCNNRSLKREGGCVQCVTSDCGYSKCE